MTALNRTMRQVVKLAGPASVWPGRQGGATWNHAAIAGSQRLVAPLEPGTPVVVEELPLPDVLPEPDVSLDPVVPVVPLDPEVPEPVVSVDELPLVLGVTLEPEVLPEPDMSVEELPVPEVPLVPELVPDVLPVPVVSDELPVPDVPLDPEVLPLPVVSVEPDELLVPGEVLDPDDMPLPDVPLVPELPLLSLLPLPTPTVPVVLELVASLPGPLLDVSTGVLLPALLPLLVVPADPLEPEVLLPEDGLSAVVPMLLPVPVAPPVLPVPDQVGLALLDPLVPLASEEPLALEPDVPLAPEVVPLVP